MPAPSVSIITALADREGHRLTEIHGALERATTTWEWLIQLDGDAPLDVPQEIRADDRAALEANGRQLGIAATRNRALARTTAPLLLNADSDDVPTPAALDALAPAFDDLTVGLAFGDWIEHWPERGSWTPEPRFHPGRLAPGTLSAIWGEDRWVPMHLAGAMWRTDAVLAAGGWTATLGGSDIGLMLGVEASWASVYIPVRTFAYHHHASQATASGDWQSQFDRDMRFLERRRARWIQRRRRLSGRTESHLRQARDR